MRSVRSAELAALTDEHFREEAASFDGWSCKPIEIDDDLCLVGGHARYQAALRLGHPVIPSVRRKHPGNGGRFPDRLLIEVTRKCNLSCVFCPVHAEGQPPSIPEEDMDLDVFRKVMDECRTYPQVELLMHFYGEPFMNKKLFEYLDHLRPAPELRPVWMSTNGRLLDGDKIARLLDSPITYLQVSVNGISEDKYSRLMVNSDFGVVVHNVEKLLDAKARSGRRTPFIRLQMIELDQTHEDAMAFVRRWGEAADIVHVNAFEKQGGRLPDYHTMRDGRPETRRMCRRLERSDMVVLANGEVTVCVYDYDGVLSLGNVKDLTMLQLWQEGFLAFRERHRRNEWTAIPLCSGCSDWWL
ncbi:MAG: radical SAM protein [Deltaproteobacteria bacterium]|nr:radical SAM protein [Deltaproteobacteria bacterium]